MNIVTRRPINIDEPLGKTVGRRTSARDPLSPGGPTPADSKAWLALGGLRVPRGVYRFRTHNEADEWLWRMMTRRNPT
jgi:hypothetical protein